MATLSETARTIFEQALADCSVEQAMMRHISLRDGCLAIDGEIINLEKLRRIRIIAMGKAANPMFEVLWHQLLSLACDIRGVIIAPSRPKLLPPGFAFFAGGHPSPNAASFAGAQAVLALLKGLPQDSTGGSLCIFLISGGASAMMELPLDAGISLDDTVEFHRALVASGASITEINCIRKHFSAVKGGRVARAAGTAICRTLLISDVPAGHEDALGSGPTLPDRSTIAECHEILARYRLLAQFPAAVRRFFESKMIPETPKAEELSGKARVVLSSDDLAQAASNHARTLGLTAIIDNTCDDWDYKKAAQYLLDRLRTLRSQHGRVCLISTGELLVRLPRNTAGAATIGVGGRNLQFALYAATLLARQDGPIAILSAGSDGVDGNSAAAGAVIDENTVMGQRLQSAVKTNGPGIAAAAHALENFDAYPFLAKRNATIVTGPSGNNLRDLRLFLAEPAS